MITSKNNEISSITKHEKITFLYAALKEAQDNVRAFDTKSQIVGIGFIFSLNIIPKLGPSSSANIETGPISVIVAWILVILPLLLFGSVLYPSRKVAPKILKNKTVVKGLFHVNDFEISDVTAYSSRFNEVRLEEELAYELLKVSSLRDLKRNRFLSGLILACIGFLAIFSSQVFNTLNIN